MNAGASPRRSMQWAFVTRSSPLRHTIVTEQREAVGAVNLMTHLFIHEIKVGPGGEWADDAKGWRIVRVTTGFFYWLSPAGARELNPGDVAMIGPKCDGVLRASVIGEATLQCFAFGVEHLAGMMSLAERMAIEALGNEKSVRIVAAKDSLAKDYASIAGDAVLQQTFVQRCRILNLVGSLFAGMMPEMAAPGSDLVRTEIRFAQIIDRMPDSELMILPPEKLAEICGCSTRHVRRMFRKRFQTSIRTKQTELRLEKARQLLADTDEKVVSIALESGYRHVGFFNAMFKKKFGVTPSEWRRLNSPRATAKRRGREVAVSQAGGNGRA